MSGSSDQTTSGKGASASASEALQLERSYWESYEDYDWSSDEAKEQAIACIPRLDGDILELCVGGGAFARKIPKTYRSYTGLDLSQSLLNALKKSMPHVKTMHGDAQDLPFEEETFDAVIVFSGLHHLPRYQETLASAIRILRPGGCFFCFEPNDRAWYRAPMRFLRRQKRVRDFIEIYSEDEVYLDPGEVSDGMAAAGFSDVQTHYMTPRFNPDFLSFTNRIFARMMYSAAALGNSMRTQSYFAMSGRKS
jgi:demethylmenaquinone methyltransferase/2-methoxy-6-polyprenyl-1,4-benzoquinol methylase